MTTSLLTTKFYIPRIDHPRGVVTRPRLMEHLNEGLDRKLTLVSAPAGYGKTTLVGEWVHSVGAPAVPANAGDRDAPLQVAWLSLDENDNDPTRFLSYVVAALRTAEVDIATGALSALQSPQPPPAEAILTALINEIAPLPGRFLLVLDDYHLIEAQPVHEAVRFLLRHLPPVMHLVIVTRDDPPLPLARLRARGQMTELRAADLRFSSSEAAEFLNRVMGLDLSEGDIAALETRTEGWIAGLQLAAVSMQGRTDVTGFIQSFTGSHRFVLDYLVEEILEQQSEEVQAFLLRTSILDRLSGPLCDAVLSGGSGEPGSSKGTASQVILEALERTNLFIVPLDDERRWYRYHHLFADLLRQRLRQTQPEQVPTFHRRASEWFEQNGFVGEAIEHALVTEDFERALSLLERVTEGMWGRDEHSRLTSWLAKLPPELICTRPQLCVFYARFLFAGGQQDAAERVLQAAEESLDPNSERPAWSPLAAQEERPATERMKLSGRIAATRALMASYRSDAAAVIPHARKALEYLPEQDVFWRGSATIALGDAFVYQGQYSQAHQTYLQALEAIKTLDNPYLFLNVNARLAMTLRSQGRLQQAIETSRVQLDFANRHGLAQTEPVGWLAAIMGEALAEVDDLDGAIVHAKRGVELVERGKDVAMLSWSYMCLARVLYSLGDLAEAEKIIRRTEALSQEATTPLWVNNQMTNWQARIWLRQGRLDEALRWMQEQGIDQEIESTYVGHMVSIPLARIQVAQGSLETTNQSLQPHLEAAEAGGHISRAIELLILQALASQAGNETEEAMLSLQRAFSLAEPGGFIRTFVDEGPQMVRLLYEALDRGIAPDYVRRLLAAFPPAEPDQTDASESPASDSVLIEPLSEREIEVLQLIAEGMTNPEIATRLFLSPHTVKAHTRNIYGKLGVHNRIEAAARARVLGVLPPT